jgi:RNA polymerase sigma-32 factor
MLRSSELVPTRQKPEPKEASVKSSADATATPAVVAVATPAVAPTKKPRRKAAAKTGARAKGKTGGKTEDLARDHSTEPGESDAGESDHEDHDEREDHDAEVVVAEPVEAELVSDDDEPALADDDAELVDADDDVKPPRSAPLSTETGMERMDPMSAYLREVQRHRLLTPEETQELAVRFLKTQDSKVAARLVTANLRLVVKIAYEYRRAYKNIMDLVQEGNIGLMQAVKRYDPYRGVKLSSYAAWWIRAYILRFILNNWRLVKLGTTQAQRKLFFNLKKARAELAAMGVDPSDAEVAKRLNVPESDVSEMEVRLQASEKSLDAPVGDADGRSITRVDMMPAMGAGPEAMMADGELQALLREKLEVFRGTLVGKEKELAIFDERLIADDPLTLQELGERFHISRERVRQLEQRLQGKLRDFLKREMGDATELA